MKERKDRDNDAWPRIDIARVETDWWDTVMKSTAKINMLFDTRLNDDDDFTIRSLVHVIVSDTEEDIKWRLENSMHLGSALQINALFKSKNSNDCARGRESLENLIQEFTDWALE